DYLKPHSVHVRLRHALAQGASAHAGRSARTGAKIARHESGIEHTTTSLHARMRHRRSGGDDPCCEDLSRDKTECRAPRAWWPTPGGAQLRGALFPESEVMHHRCRNGTSRNNVTRTSN